MPHSAPSTLLGPPGDILVETLRSIVRDDLRIVAEYNRDTFYLLYVADYVLDAYETTDDIRADGRQLHAFYQLDGLERDLLEYLLPLGAVETQVTYLEEGVLIRASSDTASAFISVGKSASTDDIQTAVNNTL